MKLEAKHAASVEALKTTFKKRLEAVAAKSARDLDAAQRVNLQMVQKRKDDLIFVEAQRKTDKLLVEALEVKAQDAERRCP